MSNTNQPTILYVTDRNGRQKEFYNSDVHIKGDTRFKMRANPSYDFIFQYMSHDDYDGIRMDVCIAIDDAEFADLKARGVQFYEVHYSGGKWYRIALSEFEKWAHPVTGKFGSQHCVSWRHWENYTDEQPYEKRTKKAKKPALSKVIPLRNTNPLPSQLSMFEGR